MRGCSSQWCGGATRWGEEGNVFAEQNRGWELLRATRSGPVSPWRHSGRRRRPPLAARGPGFGLWGRSFWGWVLGWLFAQGEFCTSLPLSISSRRVAPPISDALPIRRLLPTSALLAHPPFLPPLIDSPSAPTPTSIMLPSPLDCSPVCFHSLLSS